MGGRGQFLLLVCAGVVCMGALFALRGYERTWHVWGIPTMTPHFGDARVITSGLESLRDGYDPLVNNIRDPWHRPMNYPRVWHLLAWLGMEQRHTTLLGMLFIGAFALGLTLLSAGIDPFAAWLMALCLFSPAVLFGVERANNDLLMFFLLALAVTVLPRRSGLAFVLVGAGAVLKVFPVFGLAMLLRAPRRQALGLLGLGTLMMLLYAALTFHDLYNIREVTPQSIRLAYGVNVVWNSVRAHFAATWVSHAVALSSYLALLGACVGAIELGRHTVRKHGAAQNEHLDAFRTGAAVYLGSFVLFTNWDYRLMFLLFTVPALSRWARERTHPACRTARLALAAIVVACWSLGLHAAAARIPHALPVWFLIDQGAKWTVFVSLLFLFACTLPSWMYPVAHGNRMVDTG